VTSRAELGVGSEQEFVVLPLELPEGSPDATAADVETCEAVALFLQRVRAVQPDFVLRDDDAPAVAAICRRVDGLPLAIELAAARLRLLSPRALASRIERSLDVLSGGEANLPARQRTMRGALIWGHNLLDADEQAIFRRVAIFVGGCDLTAAEEVCVAAGSLGVSVLDGLAALANESLLRQETLPDGEARLMMLETVREFGLEQLQVHGETEITRQAHARFFLNLAERTLPHLSGPGRTIWLDHLQVEHDNLRAALTWMVEADEAASALRAVIALWPFWEQRGFVAEGQTWFERALALDGGEPQLREQARRLATLPVESRH